MDSCLKPWLNWSLDDYLLCVVRFSKPHHETLVEIFKKIGQKELTKALRTQQLQPEQKNEKSTEMEMDRQAEAAANKTGRLRETPAGAEEVPNDKNAPQTQKSIAQSPVRQADGGQLPPAQSPPKTTEEVQIFGQPSEFLRKSNYPIGDQIQRDTANEKQ